MTPASAPMEGPVYAMIQVAETLREAYGRVLQRKGCLVMSQSELPAGKEKLKAALLLCAYLARSNGRLDDRMFNAYQVSYGSLADFIEDEERAKRARKYEDYLYEIEQQLNPENLGWPAFSQKFQEKLNRKEIDPHALLKTAEKMREIRPADGVFGDPGAFASLCHEFEERLNSLEDSSRKPKELALLAQVLLSN